MLVLLSKLLFCCCICLCFPTVEFVSFASETVSFVCVGCFSDIVKLNSVKTFDLVDFVDFGGSLEGRKRGIYLPNPFKIAFPVKQYCDYIFRVYFKPYFRLTLSMITA